MASSKSGNGTSYSRPGQLATFPTLGDNLNEHLNDTTKSSMNNKADSNKSSEPNTKQLFEESKKCLEEYKLGIAKGKIF